MKPQPCHSTHLKKSLLLSFLLLLPSLAPAKEASPESVNKLLELSDLQKVTQDQMIKFRTMVDAMVNETVVTQKLTPAQTTELKKRMPEFSAALQKIVTEEMSWNKIKPSYAKIYEKRFTEEEITGLIAFYKSPLGKTFLEKMPLVNEEVTKAAVDRLPIITSRITKASNQFLEKIQPPPPKK
jgi:hypothetical protein